MTAPFSSLADHADERFTEAQRAKVAEFDAAPIAPESYSAATEQVAKLFHDTYERLAPEYDYETREASAVAWADVPAANRALMVATCREVLNVILPPQRYVTGLPS